MTNDEPGEKIRKENRILKEKNRRSAKHKIEALTSTHRNANNTMKHATATVIPTLATIDAIFSSLCCRGVTSISEEMSEISRPHSVRGPTARTTMRPSPSTTCRAKKTDGQESARLRLNLKQHHEQDILQRANTRIPTWLPEMTKGASFVLETASASPVREACPPTGKAVEE